MHKQFFRFFLSMISLIIAFFLLDVPLLHAESIKYEDYSDQHTYPNEIVEKHTTVYSKDGLYDVKDVQESINILEKLPEHIFEIMEVRNIQLYFIDFPLPDLERLEFLDEEEEVPGYPEGSTYRDDVFGLYIGQESENMAVVRTDEDISVSRSPSLTLHEIGHALSFGDLFTDYFSTDEFIAAHRDEQPVLFPVNDYFDIKAEYFAEIFAYYFINDERRNELREKAPRSFEYMERFIKFPFYISKKTIDEVVLTWTEIPDAESYDVIRDGVVIDNVTETSYIDNDYDNYGHTYEIKPVDQSGNQVFEFHKETAETELLEKQYLELNEELEQEAIEWEQKMESTTTLENVLEKFNIPASFLPIIFWTILISILLIIPAIVITIFLLVRRRKRRTLKQEQHSS